PFVLRRDWARRAARLALRGIGLAVLDSAGGQNMALVKSQAARYVVGLGAMWLLSRIPPPPLRRATPVFYAMSLLPLVAVLFVGTGRSGDRKSVAEGMGVVGGRGRVTRRNERYGESWIDVRLWS